MNRPASADSTTAGGHHRVTTMRKNGNANRRTVIQAEPGSVLLKDCWLKNSDGAPLSHRRRSNEQTQQ